MTKHRRIKDWDPGERPRERFVSNGASALSEAELLAIILGSGSVEDNALDLARKILSISENNLRRLSAASVDKLTEIRGIGSSKAVKIAAVFELARRISAGDAGNLPNIKSSACAAKLIGPLLRDLTHEECWVMYLNRANKLISKERMSTGGVSATVVDVRMIIRNALEKLASSLILIHNHPSGNPLPGDNDKHQTKVLKEAAAFFDISLLDHLVIAGDSYYSFADEGLM
jgi:DNA repair protein RadC